MTGAGSEGMAMNGFPTRAPIELEDRPREQQWLVDTLWGEQAVGIVGGEPRRGCRDRIAAARAWCRGSVPGSRRGSAGSA